MYTVEGIELVFGLQATARPRVAWSGRTLEAAEAAADDLKSRGWLRVAIMDMDTGETWKW